MLVKIDAPAEKKCACWPRADCLFSVCSYTCFDSVRIASLWFDLCAPSSLTFCWQHNPLAESHKMKPFRKYYFFCTSCDCKYCTGKPSTTAEVICFWPHTLGKKEGATAFFFSKCLVTGCASIIIEPAATRYLSFLFIFLGVNNLLSNRLRPKNAASSTPPYKLIRICMDGPSNYAPSFRKRHGGCEAPSISASLTRTMFSTAEEQMA